MSDTQVFDVAITPAQRFALVNLSHSQGQKMKGQRARFFRRFTRAFGLVPILDAADDHKGRVNLELMASREPAVHTLTIENIDYALGLDDSEERAPAVERILGPLFDVLECIKAKRAYEDETAGVPMHDPTAEDWRPAKELGAVAVEQRIADYLRAQGHGPAAELVDRGGWDKPATPANGNGTPAPQPEVQPEA